MNDDSYKSLRFYTYLLLFITLAFFILYQARLLLIPLGFGLVISLILYPICQRIERKVGRAMSIFVGEVILFAFGFILIQILITSISFLQQEFTNSREKIFHQAEGLVQTLGNNFSIDAAQQKTLLEQLYDNILKQLFPFLKETIFLSAGTFTMMMIIPVFVGLILLYRELLVKFVLEIVPKNQAEGFKATFRQIADTYFRFAKGMALVYLSVATLNSLGFLAIGLPNAVYLGVLASILTFFPYLGIFIGGMAAIIVAWTTFDSAWYPIGVALILGFVQYLEANVIFPVLVGKQLSINPLATLMAILLGGIIWGGAGMILFVPFVGILKLLADHIDGLKPLATLLGSATDGK
ncbi:MAG: AI-2E family transporter [Saprospiraceae bacterium]|nr:AI-2E family transporter [Saprospiraceae bacterium]